MNTFQQLLKMSKQAKVHLNKIGFKHGTPFLLQSVRMGIGAYFVNRFSFLSTDPRYLMFEITNECNLKCSGCLQGIDNSQQEQNKLLDDEKFFNLINSYPNIIVTGGEPLMPGAKPFLFRLLDDHKKDKKDNYKQIWALYTFLVWYKEYFE